jgi:hypothetical protein
MPDLSKEHAAALHERLREFLNDDMGMESPATVASALMYELASLAAAISTSHAGALGLLRNFMENAERQIKAFGVGHPHP